MVLEERGGLGKRAPARYSPGMRPHRQLKYTYREYALLPDDGKRHELIDGDFYVTPASGTRHQRLLGRLHLALAAQLSQVAEIFLAPTDVILSEHDVVEPDLLVLRHDRASLVSKRGIEGPPNLVIEILSPGNRGNDEFLKRGTYARCSVPEYWLVDPEAGFVTVLRAEQPGAPYTLLARFGRVSELTSVEFPELKLPLGPLFEGLITS